MLRFRKIVGIALLLLGCAPQPQEEVRPGDQTYYALARLPATFVNSPSCPGCLSVALTLRPDGSYLVRERLGGAEFYDFGRWRESRGEGVLHLVGGRDAPRRYALRAPDKLDSQDATPGGDLKRAAAVEPLRGPFRLLGLYDGTTFKECRTGVGWTVADSRAGEGLKREFMKRQSATALVSLDGRFEDRGGEERLVVQRLATILNQRGCPG